MGRVYGATLANFFFPGLGYIILGDRVALAVAWLLGVIGLTYVETSLKQVDGSLYTAMFASVFIMNTAFAIDAFKVGKAKFGPATSGRG